jgi:hypothetical protein
VKTIDEIYNEIKQQYIQGATGTVAEMAETAQGIPGAQHGRMSNYLENKMIDFIFRGQNYVLPTTLYAALYSARITEDADAEELSGDGYARVPVPRSLLSWAGTQGAGSAEPSSGGSGFTSNNVAIQFPLAKDEWGTALWWAILDAPAGGNILFYGELLYPRTIYPGDTPITFDPGNMTIWIDP